MYAYVQLEYSSINSLSVYSTICAIVFSNYNLFVCRRMCLKLLSPKDVHVILIYKRLTPFFNSVLFCLLFIVYWGFFVGGGVCFVCFLYCYLCFRF